MRRAAVSLAILLVAAAWASSPTAAEGLVREDCNTRAERARSPGVAIFTGHATREMPESGDVVFVVDLWFEGRTPAGWCVCWTRPRTSSNRRPPG